MSEVNINITQILKERKLIKKLQILNLIGKDPSERIFIMSLDFIFSHFQKPIFPRYISTHKSEGRQFEVYSEEEMLKAYEESKFLDCKLCAYPSYTEYKVIQRYPPNFILVNLESVSFKSKQGLNRALRSTLNRIKSTINGNPTVLWTGTGYEIYQPLEGVIFERFIEFETFEQPSVKFLKFAEQYLTNKKSPQNPSFLSYMICMPGSINSKCPNGSNEVEIIQEWDGRRPPISLLRRAFLDYLVTEKIKEVKLRKKVGGSSL